VAHQFRKFGADIAAGTFAETPLLLLAGLGLALGGAGVRRQVAGLAWAVVPYLLFVLVYWHYESRYFVFLVPWVAVLAAGTVTTLATRLLAGADAGRRRVVVWGLALGLALLLVPRIMFIVEQTPRLTSTAGDVVIGRWLAANTPPDSVIMTRRPWQTSWHGERLTVMIPLGTADEILATMRRYNVTHLVLRVNEPRDQRREALAPLYEGREAFGMTKVFELGRTEIIYRWDGA
jgi:hypothetical protein